MLVARTFPLDSVSRYALISLAIYLLELKESRQALGIGVTVLRRSAAQVAILTQRRLLVSLEISSKDPSYLWFLQWMSSYSARQDLLSSTSLRGIESIAARLKSHELAVETKYEQRSDGSSSAEFSLIPGPGTHFFRYKSAWFQVSIIQSLLNFPVNQQRGPPLFTYFCAA